MLGEFFGNLNQSLGIKEAVAKEAARGTQKGNSFQQELYDVLATLGNEVGDETEFVHGSPGTITNCKTGDHVVTLGEVTAAPGHRLVFEAKDSPVKLKKAIEELQKAKENRGADMGVYVFSRGTEPEEVGDFRRIGEDFYITVDREDLEHGRRLPYFESAYKIARALVVAGVRKQAAGEVDLQSIRDNVDSIQKSIACIADIATKARTIQKSGKLIESGVLDMQSELDERLASILRTLKSGEA
jgi:hypothetical protein